MMNGSFRNDEPEISGIHFLFGALIAAIPIGAYLMSETPEERFWRSVLHEEQALLASVANKFPSEETEKVVSGVGRALKDLDEGLYFEIASDHQTGLPTIYISADGDISKFELIQSLVDQAPVFQQLDVRAFRQPSPHFANYAVNFAGSKLVFGDLRYSLLRAHDSDEIELVLAYPGFVSSEFETQTVAYLALDNAIGEYDTTTILDKVYFEDPSDVPEWVELKEFEELPAEFGRLK